MDKVWTRQVWTRNGPGLDLDLDWGLTIFKTIIVLKNWIFKSVLYTLNNLSSKNLLSGQIGV